MAASVALILILLGEAEMHAFILQVLRVAVLTTLYIHKNRAYAQLEDSKLFVSALV